MGRTLALRKCGEHEDCQLQSVNRGPWKHTPAKTPLARRLATKPEEVEALEARLAGEVGEVTALRVQMGERLLRLDQRLHGLENVAGATRRAELLLQEAERVGDELKGEQGELRGKSHRLVRDLERLDRLTGKLEAAVAESAERSRKAEQDATEAAEKTVRISERLPVLDRLQSEAEDLSGKLARIDEVIRIVNDADSRFKEEVETLRAEINEALRQIAHERTERLADTAKTQRQFREVMRHVGPS